MSVPGTLVLSIGTVIVLLVSTEAGARPTAPLWSPAFTSSQANQRHHEPAWAEFGDAADLLPVPTRARSERDLGRTINRLLEACGKLVVAPSRDCWIRLNRKVGSSIVAACNSFASGVSAIERATAANKLVLDRTSSRILLPTPGAIDCNWRGKGRNGIGYFLETSVGQLAPGASVVCSHLFNPECVSLKVGSRASRDFTKYAGVQYYMDLPSWSMFIDVAVDYSRSSQTQVKSGNSLLRGRLRAIDAAAVSFMRTTAARL
jgi:hypothetical protein